VEKQILGIVSEPVIYEVEKGRIKEIRGGKEVKIIKKWFEKLDDPNMYLAARVWGCTEWGFGYQGPMYSGGKPRVAASHIDGICLACSVYCDDDAITRDGEVVHRDLVELSRVCGH